VLLVGAALLYVYFRMTPDAGTAGLAAAAVFGTAQGLGYVATRIVLEDQVRAQPGWLLLSQVLVAVILVVLLALGGHWRGADPLQVGLCLAIVLSVGRLVLVERAFPSAGLEKAMPLLGGALLLSYGAMALLLLRNLRLPAWATWRLALAMSLLGVAHLLTYPVAEPDWHSVLAIGGNVAGATMLVMTSVRLVRSAEDRHLAAERLVRTLEGHVRHERTLLHEVASSVAGITAASRLLTGQRGLDREDRERLTQLLLIETARLERLIAAGHDLAGPQPIGEVDLDSLVEPLLLAHEIRGRVVTWRPSHVRVRARRDDLVEVLDLLLDNAARHAHSPSLALTVDRRGDEVDVTVVDEGVGIPPEIAGSVLEWGSHGPSSTGQGIGLNVAQRLMQEQDGYLRVVNRPRGGSTFIVGLPVDGEDHDAAHSAAQ
jgi:signal transduction histidine kinase